MNLKFIEQDVLDKAVLFKTFLIAQSTDGSVSAEEIAGQFDINIGVKRVKLACEALSEQKQLRYFSQTSRGSISAVGYKYVEDALRDETSVINRYAVSGDDWLAEQTVGAEALPASDRLVSRQDNQKVFQEIEDDLDCVIEGLRADNELGDALGDEKEIFLAESKAASELLVPGKFHLKRLATLIIPALKFLSEKFAGAAVGDAAKRLIALILALF